MKPATLSVTVTTRELLAKALEPSSDELDVHPLSPSYRGDKNDESRQFENGYGISNEGPKSPPLEEQPSSTHTSIAITNNNLDEQSEKNHVSDESKEHSKAVLATAAQNSFSLNSVSAQYINRNIKRQYDHVIRMLITVTVMFSICQIPDMLIQLISRLYSTWELSDEFAIIAYDFVIINSSVNLFIYTATSQRFKKNLYLTFKCLYKKDRVAPMPGGQSTLEQS